MKTVAKRCGGLANYLASHYNAYRTVENFSEFGELNNNSPKFYAPNCFEVERL